MNEQKLSRNKLSQTKRMCIFMLTSLVAILAVVGVTVGGFHSSPQAHADGQGYDSWLLPRSQAVCSWYGYHGDSHYGVKWYSSKQTGQQILVVGYSCYDSRYGWGAFGESWDGQGNIWGQVFAEGGPYETVQGQRVDLNIYESTGNSLQYFPITVDIFL